MTRIYGFDLLRGLCALGVVIFHALYWTNRVLLSNIGLFYVDLFFVISGASLYWVYSDRLAGATDMFRYFCRRLARLLPLYLVLVVVGLYYFRASWTAAEVSKTYLNVTMLFALGVPGEDAAVGNGWSLGVEMVFYLSFPVLAAFVRSRVWWVVAVLLMLGQRCYYEMLFQHGTLVEQWARYTHFLSFVYYFYIGGCIGRLVREVEMPRWRVSWVLLPLMLVLLAVANPAVREDTLRGMYGTVLILLIPGLVVLAATIGAGSLGRIVATQLGDISYGVYLIHPLVAGRVPRWIIACDRWLLTVGYIVLVSIALAWLSSRLIEMPIRGWWRRNELRWTSALFPRPRSS
jgi:peptidoglycan/LPS O-acetylase OafA/YrhL